MTEEPAETMRVHVHALSLSGEPVSPSYGIYSFVRRVVCVSRERNTTIMVVSFAAENFKYSSTMPLVASFGSLIRSSVLLGSF